MSFYNLFLYFYLLRGKKLSEEESIEEWLRRIEWETLSPEEREKRLIVERLHEIRGEMIITKKKINVNERLLEKAEEKGIKSEILFYSLELKKLRERYRELKNEAKILRKKLLELGGKI